MRNLYDEELALVHGGGGDGGGDGGNCREKSNNGWGNGSENAFPPGNSGFTPINSQLLSKLTDAER